jgi:Fe2+ transport system protein FeoA
MTLNDSKPLKKYQIVELICQDQNDPRVIRLKQFGFIPGHSLSCKQLSPWLKNPILFEIRGMRVALTKEEASLVKVKEIES